MRNPMPYSPLIAKLRAVTRIRDEDAAKVNSTWINEYKTTAGSDIVSAGTRIESLRVILDGWAARYRMTADGNRQLTELLIPGDFCNVHATILPAMDHGVTALTDCRVGKIDVAALDNVIIEVPVLARAIWRSVLIDLTILREWIASADQHDPLKTVAHLLCQLHARLEIIGRVRANRFVLPLTDDDVASVCGLPAMPATNCLDELKDWGLISRKGEEITLNDLRAIHRFAGYNARHLQFRKPAERATA